MIGRCTYVLEKFYLTLAQKCAILGGWVGHLLSHKKKGAEAPLSIQSCVICEPYSYHPVPTSESVGTSTGTAYGNHARMRGRERTRTSVPSDRHERISRVSNSCDLHPMNTVYHSIYFIASLDISTDVC
jgi:hypothetical protein